MATYAACVEASSSISDSAGTSTKQDTASKMPPQKKSSAADTIDPVSSRWRFDRRIPILPLLAVLVQTVGLVVGLTVWSTKVDSRLTALELSVSESRGVGQRIAVLEARQETSNALLNRIDSRLDRIEDRRER